MFSHVTHRFARALIYMLVAAQLLLSVPAAAFSGQTAAATVEIPSADYMPTADDGQSCPCCPDGVMNTAACLSACAASVGFISMMSLPQRVNSAVATESAPDIPRARRSEPPLKPPQIV
jgi:hypothetical protein